MSLASEIGNNQYHCKYITEDCFGLFSQWYVSGFILCKKKKKECFQYQFVHCNYQAKYTQGCFYFMCKEFLQIKKKQIHIPGGKWAKIFNGHSQEPPWMSNKPRRCTTTLPISANENVSIYKIRKVEQDWQDLLLVKLERLSNTHSW